MFLCRELLGAKSGFELFIDRGSFASKTPSPLSLAVLDLLLALAAGERARALLCRHEAFLSTFQNMLNKFVKREPHLVFNTTNTAQSTNLTACSWLPSWGHAWTDSLSRVLVAASYDPEVLACMTASSSFVDLVQNQLSTQVCFARVHEKKFLVLVFFVFGA